MALLRFAGFRSQTDQPAVDFGIADPVVPVTLWERGGGNRYEVNGTLTVGDQPVAGAILLANTYTLPEPTAEDGSFTLHRDKTVLERTILKVKDLASATIAGDPVSDAEREALLAAEFTVETAYVLTLDGEPTLTVGAPNQTIRGTLTFSDGVTPIPPVNLWGYQLSGVLYDENDQPIEGAYVSIRDDEGETWSLSGRTGADGRYTLRFYPLGGSEFIVRAAIGLDAYQSEEAILFDDETSAVVDVKLDLTNGRLIGTGPDGAFEVEDVPGAEYVGYMAGLAVGNKPIQAETTWPDETGAFSITISSLETTETLSFFQARLRFFTTSEVHPGGVIAEGIIPETLDPLTPEELPPFITPVSG